jgi:hypothetical protein
MLTGSQFGNEICTSIPHFPIDFFEQINNLRNSTPDGIIECGYP